MSANIHMAPWPNRMRPTLPFVVPTDIHGVARLKDWEAFDSGVQTVIGPEDGWPWKLKLACVAEFSHGVHFRVSAENLSGMKAPFAYGMHLYLTVGTAPIDACFLTTPMFGTIPLVGQTFDDCFSWGETTRSVRLQSETGAAVELTTDESFAYLQLFTADEQFSDPYPYSASGTGRAIAVEPMTAPAYALNTGEGLRWLKPGESVKSSLTLRWVEEN